MSAPGERYAFDEWLTALWVESLDAASDGAAYTLGMPPEVEVAFAARLLEDAGRLLAPYSHAEAAMLWHLVSDSGAMHALLAPAVSWRARERCVRAFVPLYEQVFLPGCSPHLSHLDKPGADPLNLTCYMWWDLMAFWGPANAEGARWNVLFLDVMEATLGMPSDPCRESAIHGLGHMPHARGRAEAILSTFLAGASGLRSALAAYAVQRRMAACHSPRPGGSVEGSVRPAGSAVEEVVWTCTVLPS
jgi:hypothetical protein